MTDVEIDNAFGGMPSEHPFWLAVQEILQRNVDQRVSETSAPAKNYIAQRCAGALNDALEIRHAFLGRMARIKPEE